MREYEDAWSLCKQFEKIHSWQKTSRSRGGCCHETARNSTTSCEMMTLKVELRFATQLGIYSTIWRSMEPWLDFILSQLPRQFKKIIISLCYQITPALLSQKTLLCNIWVDSVINLFIFFAGLYQDNLKTAIQLLTEKSASNNSIRHDKSKTEKGEDVTQVLK